MSLVAATGRTRPRARLTGVGTYVPERVLTNAELEEMVETSDEWIVSRTGIRERHIAADDHVAMSEAVAALHVDSSAPSCLLSVQ